MKQEFPSLRKNLRLALLAGTCLGTNASLSNAATVTETTDFSNNLAGALSSPLPIGTDVVNGTVTSVSDAADFVVFTNLLSGSAFTLSFTMDNAFDLANFDSLNTGGTHEGSPAAVFGQNSAVFTGTVPVDGKLVAQVGYSESIAGAYTINLAATTVPEPNSAVLAALGVSAAALRRSRRIKQSP